MRIGGSLGKARKENKLMQFERQSVYTTLQRYYLFPVSTLLYGMAKRLTNQNGSLAVDEGIRVR